MFSHPDFPFSQGQKDWELSVISCNLRGIFLKKKKFMPSDGGALLRRSNYSYACHTLQPFSARPSVYTMDDTALSVRQDLPTCILGCYLCAVLSPKCTCVSGRIIYI